MSPAATQSRLFPSSLNISKRRAGCLRLGAAWDGRGAGGIFLRMFGFDGAQRSIVFRELFGSSGTMRQPTSLVQGNFLGLTSIRDGEYHFFARGAAILKLIGT